MLDTLTTNICNSHFTNIDKNHMLMWDIQVKYVAKHGPITWVFWTFTVLYWIWFMQEFIKLIEDQSTQILVMYKV